MNSPTEIQLSGDAPYIRPRDAATLILLDTSSGEPKVLMGRRSRDLTFMPGLYVFPGGRTERADSAAPRTGKLNDADLKRLVGGMGAKGSIRRAEALALSAIRETHEETGLFVARENADSKTKLNGVWRQFGERGLAPDLSALRFVARAITPPGRIRRFDTRFFTAFSGSIANPRELVANPDEELEEVRWISVAEVMEMKIHQVTKNVLSVVAERLEADPALTQNVAVPYFRVERRRFVHSLE